MSGELVRRPILELILQAFPRFGPADALATTELNEYHRRYLENYLVREVGELSGLEPTVLSNVHERRTLTDKVEEPEQPLTLGQLDFQAFPSPYHYLNWWGHVVVARP